MNKNYSGGASFTFEIVNKRATTSADSGAFGGYYCNVGKATTDDEKLIAVVPLSAVDINNNGGAGLLTRYNGNNVVNPTWCINANKAATYSCDFLVIKRSN